MYSHLSDCVLLIFLWHAINLNRYTLMDKDRKKRFNIVKTYVYQKQESKGKC